MATGGLSAAIALVGRARRPRPLWGLGRVIFFVNNFGTLVKKFGWLFLSSGALAR